MYDFILHGCIHDFHVGAKCDAEFGQIEQCIGFAFNDARDFAVIAQAQIRKPLQLALFAYSSARRNRITVRIKLRIAQLAVDGFDNLLRDRMLNTSGLLMHVVPRVAAHLV